MNKLKSGIILTEGEVVVAELEAELSESGGDLLDKLLAPVKKFFAWVFGCRRKGYLVITNKRVVEIVAITNCYVFTSLV